MKKESLAPPTADLCQLIWFILTIAADTLNKTMRVCVCVCVCVCVTLCLCVVHKCVLRNSGTCVSCNLVF